MVSGFVASVYPRFGRDYFVKLSRKSIIRLITSRVKPRKNGCRTWRTRKRDWYVPGIVLGGNIVTVLILMRIPRGPYIYAQGVAHC